MSYCRKNTIRVHRSGVLICLLIFLLGCGERRGKVVFYPIDSLVTAQSLNLANTKALLQKEVMLGNKTERQRYIPQDTTAWVKELEVFRQLSILNKPVNQGNYSISDGLYDSGSNLTVKAFISKKPLPVRWFKVYYDHTTNKLRKIAALYQAENALYESTRLLHLEFEQINNETILTSYAINGGQKMVLGDTVTFSVTGKIQVD